MLHITAEDDGFTLIELLVVVVIIGILAAIAIPAFVNQRERAWEAAAQSDLRGGILAQEAHFAENGRYTRREADLTEYGFRESSNVNFWIGGRTNDTRFRLHAQHCDGGDRFRFFSDRADEIERIGRSGRRC